MPGPSRTAGLPKTPVFGSDEIGQLSQAFNYMTSRLREALSQNEEEKEKLASILTNMSDGVIATDEAGRVILMNRRAGEMLGVEGEELAGHDIVSLLGLEESNRRRWRAAKGMIPSCWKLCRARAANRS